MAGRQNGIIMVPLFRGRMGSCKRRNSNHTMTTYLERYQSGEHETVWAELFALGVQVRQEPLLTDASAVARETMRRVRTNIELLIPRLETLGYQFGIWEDGKPVELYSGPLRLPSAATPEGIAQVEQELGPLPLSLWAFAEVIGTVDFCGHHPEWASKYGPLDPLVVEVPFDKPDYVKYVLDTVREDAEHAQEEGEEGELFIVISPDIYHKDNISGGMPYEIALNVPAADGPVERLDPRAVSYNERIVPFLFISYLRICLRWGGFPAFADIIEQERPHEQLAFLTQGLLPF